MAALQMGDFRYIGKTGLKVSAICLGTMTFGGLPIDDSALPKTRPGQTDEAASHAILDRFVELGGNFIDTADVYPASGSGQMGESEEIIGTWLKKRQELRPSLVLATKVRFQTRSDPFAGGFNGGGLTRNHILWSIEQSLKRLQTNYVDLYQIHCWDNVTPIEETFKTLDTLVQNGKIRYIGVSNVTGWQLQKICDIVKALNLEPVVTLQAQYSLLSRGIELELTEVCKNEGVGILPWSPLKGGLLTGKFGRDVVPPEGSRAAWVKDNPHKKSQACPLPDDFNNDKTHKLLEGMRAIAESKSVTDSDPITLAQVALRWVLQKPGVSSVIIGAKTISQLEDNIKSLTLELSEEEMRELDGLSAMDIPYPYEMIWRCNNNRGRDWVVPKTYP